ncbi:MAG: 50S ribosomal protein L25, partial [Patescibacteria group bacterium]
KVKLDEKIKTKVPVVFVGEAPAVKDLAGIFVRNVNELEVEAFPQHLPHDIQVDISVLKSFDDTIHLKDLKVSSEVKILGNPEEVIASVTPPRTEAEMEALKATPVESKVEEVKVETEEKKAEREQKKAETETK